MCARMKSSPMMDARFVWLGWLVGYLNGWTVWKLFVCSSVGLFASWLGGWVVGCC